MFPKHFSAGENTYNNCLQGGVSSALPEQRGQLQVHHEFVLHSHLGGLAGTEGLPGRFIIQGERRLQKARVGFCCPPAGPSSRLLQAEAMVYKTCCWTSRLLPSKSISTGGWGAVGDALQVSISAERFASLCSALSPQPPAFYSSLPSPRIHPMPPLGETVPWLTVQ